MENPELWVTVLLRAKTGRVDDLTHDIHTGAITDQLEDLLGYGAEHPNQAWYIAQATPSSSNRRSLPPPSPV